MLIGDTGVGKTSLVSRACGEPFSTRHLATIGVDFKCHRMVMDGTTVKVQVVRDSNLVNVETESR